MPDDKQKEIFRRNLIRYLGDTPQADVAKAIGVSPQTFNTWCVGKAMPRIGKVQLLAYYFGIRKSDLIEESPEDISPPAKLILDVIADCSEEELEEIRSYAEYIRAKRSTDPIPH